MVGSYQNPGRDDLQTTNTPLVASSPSSSNNTNTNNSGIMESKAAKNKRVKNKIRKTLLLICIMFLIASFSTGIYLISSKNNEMNKEEKMHIQQLDVLNSKETTAESGCQSTVILMRHCEKIGTTTKDTHGNEHCSLPGLQRADFLPSLFIDKEQEKARWPVPAYLYALGTARHSHHNYREIETLQPLATATNLTIDSRFKVGDGPYLADEVFNQLADGSLCGKVTLVCWKHSDIPEMARALGCGTRSGCPKIYPKHSFDQVWLINFFFDAREQYETLIQEEEEKLLEVMDEGDKNNDTTRYLKKKKRKKKWSVYGSVSEFGFDPLQYSKQQGIYH